MPRGRSLSSIFLMLVLILGLTSYPSSIPSIGLVFADDDDNDDNKKEKKDKNEKAVKSSDRDDDDDDNKKEKKDKNEKAVKSSDRDDDDKEDEIEIEVKIEKGKAKIEIEIDDEEIKLKLDTTDKEEIFKKIKEITGLEDDEIKTLTEFEIEDEEDENEDEEDDDKQRIEVKIKKGTAKVKINIDDRKSKLELGTTNLDRILAIIQAVTGLDESKIRDIWDVEIEDKKDKVTICHFPPGNPGNAHTISVGSKAAQTHILKHGDLMGECEGGGPGLGDISIHGVKFFDENKDGERNGEEGLEGWEIVLKLSSKTVDTTFTNSDGEYWFEGLKEGTYEVKEVQKPGYLQTTPQNPETFTILLSSDSKIRAGFDFGNALETMLESNEVFQNLSPNQMDSIENADDIISQLLQRIEELETRLQGLLEKLESGEYYGHNLEIDPVTRSFGMSFEGSATSQKDSNESNVVGEIFIESLVTRDNSSKFRVIGGEISIGDETYDLFFGKARTSSSGSSGEKDSMVLIAHLFDDEGNEDTMKLIIDFQESLEGNFGLEPIEFEIKSQSAISNNWTISASGQMTAL